MSNEIEPKKLDEMQALLNAAAAIQKDDLAAYAGEFLESFKKYHEILDMINRMKAQCEATIENLKSGMVDKMTACNVDSFSPAGSGLTLSIDKEPKLTVNADNRPLLFEFLKERNEIGIVKEEPVIDEEKLRTDYPEIHEVLWNAGIIDKSQSINAQTLAAYLRRLKKELDETGEPLPEWITQFVPYTLEIKGSDGKKINNKKRS